MHKRGGEFIEGELAKAIDTELGNREAVEEIIRRAGDRKAGWCSVPGVDHAEHICDEFRAQGVSAECLTGKTPKRQREEMLAAFKAKEIRALTNANILTTGFDAPDTDLVAMLRPTMSPALYVQMAGRGLRPKSHRSLPWCWTLPGERGPSWPDHSHRAAEEEGQGRGTSQGMPGL